MTLEIQLLTITALSIGFIHTLIGPDHYLPFIAIGKARNWSLRRSLCVTFACGAGHVLSSVVLGLVGVAFGVALNKLEIIESLRGDIAAWLLFAFGFTYFVWGMWKAIKNRPHKHLHGKPENITAWVLFTIFVFGPCEPLIPILMYPAAKESIAGLIIVAIAFSTATIGTMMAVVAAAYYGLSLLPLAKAERYMHATAGATITLAAAGILFLGL